MCRRDHNSSISQPDTAKIYTSVRTSCLLKECQQVLQALSVELLLSFVELHEHGIISISTATARTAFAPTSTYIVSFTSMFSASDTPLGNRHLPARSMSIPRVQQPFSFSPLQHRDDPVRRASSPELTAAHSRADPAGAPSPAGSACLADPDIPCPSARSCFVGLVCASPAALPEDRGCLRAVWTVSFCRKMQDMNTITAYAIYSTTSSIIHAAVLP